MEQDPSFRIIPPKGPEVPILISVPHCGTSFPSELVNQYHPSLAASPDDTDWFVDTLYDFAADLGITMIAANYSRWVIDLNRDPASKPLYTDGRIITGLCPTTNFLGEPIYVDGRTEIEKSEIARRVASYYQPYHVEVRSILDGLHRKHGRTLLWDAHSIRQLVPTIRKEKFPDLILGDADGTSASPGLIEAALAVLDHSNFAAQHNHPFKGGYITRHFGRPAENYHALQLEMTKINYMDDAERAYHPGRAAKMRSVLKEVFEKITELL